MSNVDVVHAFLSAVAAKDVEKAISYFSEDAKVDSPMGPQKGKEAIKGGLKMMVSMPAPADPIIPEAEGDLVVARSSTPMGTFKMTFTVVNGLITHQSVKMGG